MKKKRLLKLAQRLLTLAGEETKFNMMELYDGCHPEDYDGNECGAVACIAGHAVLMKEGKDFDPKGEWIDFLGEAQDYLGLTLREREQLFLSCVPTHHLKKISPQEAAYTIIHLVLTGEVEWQNPEINRLKEMYTS